MRICLLYTSRVALADSFIALDYMFGKMQWMLDGLQTYPAKICLLYTSRCV